MLYTIEQYEAEQDDDFREKIEVSWAYQFLNNEDENIAQKALDLLIEVFPEDPRSIAEIIRMAHMEGEEE